MNETWWVTDPTDNSGLTIRKEIDERAKLSCNVFEVMRVQDHAEALQTNVRLVAENKKWYEEVQRLKKKIKVLRAEII
ncbi:hypothetical protein UFOVP903_19 [uncultured Caudovirales phage]|uniref:Uncharacterized protein n=1 Tax=uncultured Caudovirales phage TaxID=2100421 RepID=A0A6J5SA14_9CAUD|nr:hypothetical protein UFOVP903_19 [uncultured Caudovirales phage]CAB4197632.1 hypothetical protein UFOVP1318_27 [uncultured Caudovirales phage]CAB4210454.1 hypothetical protein UFOVP1430_17 [uncultured Caudovirales phage]